MSVHIQSLVYSRKLGGPSHKLVALKLADHASDDGRNIYPSVGRVAAECELSERQVQRILKDMTAQGVLRMVGDNKGGRSNTTRYEFDLVQLRALPSSYVPNGDNLAPFEERVTSAQRVTSATEKGDTTSQKGDTMSPEPSRTIIEPSDTFDRFWSAYPRKDDKGAARRAFKAALKKADAETIIEAAHRYRPTDRQFTKLPATWLNAEAWGNAPPSSQPKPITSSEAAMDANTEYWRRRMESTPR